MAGLEWDDLRYVLAVANAGSLAGAARSLGVNHTTVLRRVSAFEKRMGLRLFERLPTGYVLTAGGEELIAAARHLEDTIANVERKLAGQDCAAFGHVRVTTTDTLMASILPGILAEFRAALSRNSDRARCFKSHAQSQQARCGRRNPSCKGSSRNTHRSPHREDRIRDLWQSRLPGETPGGRSSWLPISGSGRTTVSLARRLPEWMRSQLPESEITLRADSLLGLRQAAQAGLGLAALPCYLGDTSPDLVCVHGPIAAMETALWILTHEDLRHTARVRAFIEFAANAFGRRRPLLEGAEARPRARDH